MTDPPAGGTLGGAGAAGAAGSDGRHGRRVAIMGGTFNPPHLGHVVCAHEALAGLELDDIVWMPVHSPPHKPLPEDIGVQRRLELCRLAVTGEPRFSVSSLEAERPGPSYTVDTLEALHDELPGDELTFIVGGDMAHSLPAWRAPERIVELATLAVAERDGIRRHEIVERLATVPDAVERVRFFDMPRIDISSSLIRRRVVEGRPFRHLVPDRVADYIEQERLYRSSREEVVG